MPLDPMIANPSTPKFNFGDPLVDYNNYLEAATRRGAMRKARREEEYQNALRAVFKMPGVLKPDGTVDQGVFMNALAQADLGDAILGQSKGLGEINEIGSRIKENEANAGLLGEKVNTEKADQGLKGSQAKKADADAVETQAKAFDQEWNNSRKLLFGISPDPKVGVNQFAAWIDQQFAHPVIGKGLLERGMTPEKMKAELAAAKTGAAFHQLVKQAAMDMKDATKMQYVQTNRGTSVVNEAVPEHSLGGAPKAETVSVHERVPDPKGSTIVNVNNIAAKGDEAYTRRSNEHLADDDHELKKAAEAAPELIRRADRVDQILKSGKVITGAGAPLLLAGEKLKAMVGAGDTELISNTERLGSDLAAMTLAHIKSSGLAGSNGLTEGERGFLERAVAGQITWDAASLKEAARIAREQGTMSIQRYSPRHTDVGNTGIQGRAYPKNTPKVPPAPGSMKGTNGKTISAASIAELKRNPTPQEKAEFDAYFGAGSAARVLGGK